MGELGALRKSGRTLTLEMDHTSLNSAKSSKSYKFMYEKTLCVTHKSYNQKERFKQGEITKIRGVSTDIAEHR